jgi:hypothetical protein
MAATSIQVRAAFKPASEVPMRHARNFNPEWGYLAPAPSFLRTARIVVVAAAVGASAGAAVVFSLVDHPVAEESVAARTLVLPADASAPRVGPQAVELKLANRPPSPQPMDRQATALSLAYAHAAGAAASESGKSSTTQRPPGIAALAEAPPVADAPPPATADTAAPPVATATAQRKPVRRTRFTWQSAPRIEQGPNREPLALLRPFGAYPRSDY